MLTFTAPSGTQTVFPDFRAFRASLPANTYIHGTAVVTYADAPDGRLYGRIIDMTHDYTRSRYGL